MAEVERIDVKEARRRATTKGALLDCAHEDEEKCNRIKREGAIQLANFQSRVCVLPTDQDTISSYCG